MTGLAAGPQKPSQPGQALTSGSPTAESNPAETSTSSGSNCGQGRCGGVRGRPLHRDPRTLRPLLCPSGVRVAPLPPPACQGDQPTPTQSPRRPRAAARAGRQPHSQHFPARPAAMGVSVGPCQGAAGSSPLDPWQDALNYSQAGSGGVGDTGWEGVWGVGATCGTWFHGRLTVRPWPGPRPTASASDSRRWGQ